MKKLSNFFMMALLAMGMVACSDNDVPENEGVITESDKVYMQVNVKLPNSQESRTLGSPETEEATGNEAKISDLMIALTNATGDKIYAIGRGGNEPPTPSAGGTGSNLYTVSFKQSELGDVREGENYNVIVLANTSKLSYEYTGLQDITEVKNITNWPKATTDLQMMTNAKGGFSVTFASDFRTHTTADNPYKLTKNDYIEIERSAARFDYGVVNENNVYTLQTAPKNGGLPQVNFQIVLKEMTLTNVNKKFYSLRRISDDGQNTSQKMQIGGAETGSNYVVSPYADKKLDFKTHGATLKGNYYNQLLAFHDKKVLQDGFQYKTLPTSISADDDNWATGKYSIMMYATENTLPAVGSSAEQLKQAVDEKQITTAVVFKGQIQIAQDIDDYGGRGETLSKIFEESEQVFVFRDELFVDWADVLAKSASNPALKNQSDIIQAIKASGKEPSAQDYVNAKFKVFGKNAGAKFANVYYYYFNEHQNVVGVRPDPKVAKCMEFGVVRNNVYKLKVNKIYKFGHPEDSSTDPDSPVGPIVDNEVYMSVDLKVLPWTVRVNDIEF